MASGLLGRTTTSCWILRGQHGRILHPRPPRSLSFLSTTTRSFTKSSSRLESSKEHPHYEQFYNEGIVNEQGLTVFETLHQMQVRACRVFAHHDLFGTYNPDSNAFDWMTYQQFDTKVQQCRKVLEHLGVGPYEKIGIIANNRWEWAAIAAATYSINATLVPMYEAQLVTDWKHILQDSQASLLVCATHEIYHRVQQQVANSVPTLRAVISLEGDQEPYSLSHLCNIASNNTLLQDNTAPTPQDLANLIYTSGTTGKPKGVELTHSNFCSNVLSGTRSLVDDPRVFVGPEQRSLAFLPWAHSYGQTAELWASMAHGSAIGICRGIPHIVDDLQLVRPTTLFAVPTLYKKIYAGVQKLLPPSSSTSGSSTTVPQEDDEPANNTSNDEEGKTRSPSLKSKLLQKALELGRIKATGTRKLNWLERIQHQLLDKVVLQKIRARFGGNLKLGFVAGAACPAEVLLFMDSIGIPVCEGYGLTETSPVITLSTPEQRRPDSVGRPIGGVDVYIVDEDFRPVPDGREGEICCVGPNVMRGYHRNPEATAEVIVLAPDGKSRMFRTGDLGRIGKDGFLSVTGRIKEQYKLENGKYVVPTPIEEALGMSRFISQVVVCGANRPYNVALIVPDVEAICHEVQINTSNEALLSEEELSKDPKVKALIDSEIHDSCYKLKRYEIPVKWAFVPPFTGANGMLTPKMSVRRHKVTEAHSDIIEYLYGDNVDVGAIASAA